MWTSGADLIQPEQRRRRRALALALAVSTAGAAGPLKAAPATMVVRYGGDAAFPPFESLDDQGQPRGFQIDLLAELGPVAGLDFVIALQPWAQTEAEFRQGRVDLLAMVDTPERRGWAHFAPGHATPAFAIYHRVGERDPQILQDIDGLRIAVIDSDAMRDTRKNWLAGLSGPFMPAADAEHALSAVRQGQADVALLPRAYADRLLAAGAAPGLVASRMSLRLQPYAFAVAPGHDELLARLQRGLDTLERNGRLEALRTRWLSSHRDAAERGQLERGLLHQREWTWTVSAASGIALALLGAGLWRRGRRIVAEKARRRSAEDALQHAEQLLARTFVQNPEPMLIVEHDSGVVRDANAALLSLLGLPAEALLGRPVQQLAPHVDASALQQLVQSLDTDGGLDAVPLRLQRTDGSMHDCLVSADRLAIDDAAHVFCIVRDITEQLEHDAALREGYDALATQLAQSRGDTDRARLGQARAESSLQEFTRTVAHDLRTPLHAVQGFAGLLIDRLRGGRVQEALTFGEHIDRAARRMDAMIGALARLAAVTRQPLRRQAVDMQRLAHHTWELLSAAQPARRSELHIAALPPAQADPDLAAQVWQNLLGNAWKYSAPVEGARISVDSIHDARGTWYRITDNGVGFDMAKAGALFQPFQRLHPASQFEGTGVGLSLVRRIVDHHGGEIRLRSSPGVGTVAEFTLDAAAA